MDATEIMDAWNDDRGLAEAKWRFGARLRQARERAGLSIEEVAASAGIQPETLVGREAGQTEPRLKQMVALMEAVGASPDELMHDLGRPIPIDAEMSRVLVLMLEAAPGSVFVSGMFADKASRSAGALYPTLARLERVGYVESSWEGGSWLDRRDDEAVGFDPESPRRRLYRLTALGLNLNNYRTS